MRGIPSLLAPAHFLCQADGTKTRAQFWGWVVIFYIWCNVRKALNTSNRAIKIKKPMILCARSTSRSREQSTKRRSCSENMRMVCLFHSQNNKIEWLSNMADTITRRAKVYGLFFLIVLSECGAEMWRHRLAKFAIRTYKLPYDTETVVVTNALSLALLRS